MDASQVDEIKVAIRQLTKAVDRLTIATLATGATPAGAPQIDSAVIRFKSLVADGSGAF